MGWIGVDLDATLAVYDGWRGIDHIGPPVPPMVERVKRWRSEGQEVRIFTARVSAIYRQHEPMTQQLYDQVEEALQALAVIRAWSMRVFGEVLPVTALKDLGMIECWDDRSVSVAANTGVGYRAGAKVEGPA